MKGIYAALLAVVVLACQGCAQEACTNDAPMTVVTEEAYAQTENSEPVSEAECGGYSVSELDGVAGQYDPMPMHNTYAESKAVNDDVIGWLTIDGTVIDYPVVRTGDNEYYLTHDAENNDSKYGAIYMDYRNAEPHMQKHIIIYGHNMKNGTMFHDLVNYKQKDFFTENSRIYLLWDGTDTEWQVFCALIVEPETIYPIHTLFSDDDNFAAVMNDTVKYARGVKPSNIDSTVAIQPSDQVLSLITCTYEYDDSRFVVMARRVK